MVRSLRIPTLILLLSLVAACSDQPVAPPTQAELSPEFLALNSIADIEREMAHDSSWIVFFKRGEVTNVNAQAAEIAQRHNGSIERTFEALGGFAAKLSPAAVEALRKDPGVSLVAPNDWIMPSSHHTQYNASWGLDRIDQRFLPRNTLYEYTEVGTGVHIYIIDSGISDHEQFGSPGNSRIDRDNSYDSRGGTNRGEDCATGSGHGTGVASIAGGSTLGVARDATIHPVKVLPCGYASHGSEASGGITRTSEAVDGIGWLMHNARKPAVANISFTSCQKRVVIPPPCTGPRCDIKIEATPSTDTTSIECVPNINEALDQAVRDLVSSGVPVVVAAGNDKSDSCYTSPARLSEVITVGATNSSDAPWEEDRDKGSNHGSCVDLFAPGADIRVAWANPANFTSSGSGTSLAAPFVTGAVALHLERVPNATPAAAKIAMIDNATKGVLSNLKAGSPNRLLFATAPLQAAFEGPTHLDTAGTYKWTAKPRGDVGHYSSHWYKRWYFPADSGRGPEVDLGPGPTVTLTVGEDDHLFELELRITARQQTAIHKRIIMSPCHRTVCIQSTN